MNKFGFVCKQSAVDAVIDNLESLHTEGEKIKFYQFKLLEAYQNSKI